MTVRTLVIFYLLPLLFVFCQNKKSPVPKPRTYPRVEYPAKTYQKLSLQECPFSFEYPDYAIVSLKDAKGQSSTGISCWLDIHIPLFDATIHCTYTTISEKTSFDDLVKDAFTIANQINLRSDFRDDLPISLRPGMGGLLFDFEGASASPTQFFLTDSTTHFFKAGLYFNTASKPDSLSPIIEFLDRDIAHMIKTMQWKE